MIEIMRQGQIECGCGNVYYFQSIREEVKCMKCEKLNPNNGEVVVEEILPLEGAPEEGE